MDEEGAIFLIFSLMLMLIAFSMLSSFGKGFYSIIAVLILVFGVVMILALNWADSIIIPGITSMLGITFQPANNYYITKKQDAVVKNVSGLFYATGYITANIFGYLFKEESAPEEDEERLILAPESYERLVMNIDFPYKFHVISSGMDIQTVRDELEGKRSYQEFEMSRALQGNANEVTITDIQRKMNVVQAKIDRISKGEKPIATLMYIETTAIGVSEKAAFDALEEQVKRLQVSFSAFDLELRRIVGRELYTLFQFNFALPVSFAEEASQFNQQS
ncbi:hypothetical protein M1439_01440 [Candidatus Marsarchaeota archaeon]|jgi:cell division protein FtsL|nr:hypothetical protein [Candidatus Marsarchaeota archaeon]MCL5092425.1 hypothetical protein [Candidatus Marsarchaeota archaeon]